MLMSSTLRLKVAFAKAVVRLLTREQPKKTGMSLSRRIFVPLKTFSRNQTPSKTYLVQPKTFI